MSNNQLAPINTNDLIPTPAEWATVRDMAKALLPTGFLPSAIKTPEQAVAIILKGKELRVPPLYALSNIVVVQGKPTVSAEMMLALVQRDHGMDFMWVEESTNDYCKVGYRSGGGIKFYTFSMDDAKRANLTKNPVWGQYPAAMCRARAISAVARMAAPGSIAGMYVPGELGDDVTVNSDGEVISHMTGEIGGWPEGTPPDNAAVRTQEPRRATKPTVQVSVDPTDDQEALIDAWSALDEALKNAMPDRDDEERAEIATAAFAKAGIRDIKFVPLNRVAKLTEKLENEQEATVEWLTTTYAEWAELNHID